MDDLLSRLHELNLAHPQASVLRAPFAMSMSIRCPSKESKDDVPTIIDFFAPKPRSRSTSPPGPNQDTFLTARSRVVRFYNLPLMADAFLSALFLPQHIPTPISLWTLRDSGPDVDAVWAVFKTHEEACTVLSFPGPAISVEAALESDLEPYHKLQRFTLKPIPSVQPTPTSLPVLTDAHRRTILTPSPSLPDFNLVSQLMPEKSSLQRHDYTISTNPPNPRSNFRIGDWICTSPKCAAHNFGRNLVCIGCGSPRPTGGTPILQFPVSNQPSTLRGVPSPRFATQTSRSQPTMSQGFLPYAISSSSSSSSSHHSPLMNSAAGALPKTPHPLLTPSGRGFAIGGRVRNISNDPLTPCIMYWPDNEPLPEQGQIRPNGLAVVPHPPILNTGNRGPISHQPGDWVCRKCNYLNWRRRKVCQTCLPYAEGNGDSISAAIQAERIALLTAVLAQTQLSASNTPLPQGIRSHSTTPPHLHRPPESPVGIGYNAIHRSQSFTDLTSQYNFQDASSQPIYQTSGQHPAEPLYATGPEIVQSQPVGKAAPLLPAFLQDIIQSPTLSPSSTSSADLSFEEDKVLMNTISHPPGKNDSASSSPSGNIWRLDLEESRSLNAFALSNQQEPIGTRKPLIPTLLVSQAL